MTPRVTPKNRIPDIVKAAVSVFSRKGFRLTQMEEIAKEANVSKATLYYYFRSKAHLFQYVLDNGSPEGDEPLPSPETMASMSEDALLQLLKRRLREGSRLGSITRLLRKRGRTGDLETELAEILDEMWDVFERNRVQIVILERSASTFPALAEIYDKFARKQLLSQLEQYLNARVRLGVIRPLNSIPAMARFIMESLGWFGFKQSGDPYAPLYSKAETLPDLISIFVRGLQGNEH